MSKDCGDTCKGKWFCVSWTDHLFSSIVQVRVGDAHLAETVQGLPLEKGNVLLNDRGFTRRAGIASVASLQAHQLGYRYRLVNVFTLTLR